MSMSIREVLGDLACSEDPRSVLSEVSDELPND